MSSLLQRMLTFALGRVAAAQSAAIVFALAGVGPLLAQSGWTLVPQDVTRENLWSVAYGASTVLAVGEQGTIISYRAGDQVWRREGSGTGVWLVGVGYGANRFVVVGDVGTILTSDDTGATWTSRESNTQTRLNAVAYGAGRWVAVGERGTVLTSGDGTTWSTLPALGGGFLRALTFGEGRFLLGGANGALYSSINGETFTPVAIATTSNIESIAISPNRVWLVGSDGLWASAPPSGAWSFGPGITRTTFRGVAARNADEAVAVAETGAARFRNGGWNLDTPAPPFLGTAVARADDELIAVGFAGGIARTNVAENPNIQWSGRGPVEYGANVRLISEVGTNQPVTYQWYTASGTPIPGATDRALEIRTITPETSDYQLRFQQQSSDGSTQSGSVGITVPLYPAGQVEVRDPSFVSAFPMVPSSMVAQPDGKLLVAGSFTVSPDGGPTSGLARLNADGSLDRGFRAGDGIAPTASIRALHALADGRSYVRGNFTAIAGADRPGLARLLPNGAIDPAFQPPALANGSSVSATAPDGRLYVTVGTNTDYTSGTTYRLNHDGSIDPTFGPLPNHNLVGIDSQGRVLTVDFRNGMTLLVRYRSDGSRDPAYTITPVSVFSQVLQTADELATVLITDSGLYAAARRWTRAGLSYSFSKFLPNGGRDPTYQPPPLAGVGELGFSFAYRPDGGLWQVRSISGSNTRGGFTVQSFTPSGVPDRTRYATLPNQADLLIMAVAPDGSLLGISGRHTAQPLPSFVRVYPITGVAGRLTNVSVRAVVDPASEPLIVGFVTSGSGATSALIRAVGPGLLPFGVTDPLRDPRLMLMRNGSAEATNDDWDSTLAPRFTAVGAFALADPSKDAALEAIIASGDYTAVVNAAPIEAGTALVELYDAAISGASLRRFINVSARSTVARPTPLIAGFMITGDVPVKVLVRAAGPALAPAPFNVGGVLADPKLTLYRGATALWDNDDWTTLRITNSVELRNAANGVGAFAFPADSRDSALMLTLAPGSYTAVVTGGDSGIALVEVYEVP